jgi:adenine-specific DNA-methyltransferase
MRYFGSKTSTVQQLFNLVSERIPSGTFCDPFGGIGTVASYFKQNGYLVTSGDILSFAHSFQTARIVLNRPSQFRRLQTALNLSSSTDIVNHLNSLKPISGWLTREYAQERLFFTPTNAKRIDACRRAIKRWKTEQLITPKEHAVLIASLIDSMDKVANTAGTYYAFLKSWHRKAMRPFSFEIVRPVAGPLGCRAVLTEAETLVADNEVDILYLDPPYNHRSYPRYYHLPESIALGLTPRVHGSAGMPKRQFHLSRFNRPNDAANALRDILSQAKYKLLVFHYSDDGLIDAGEVKSILHKYGRVEEHSILAAGYTNVTGPRSIDHRLYLVNND